jgi:urease accessory protein
MKPKDLPGAAIQPDDGLGLQADIEFARNANGATGIRRQRVGYPFHLGRALQMPGDPAGMPTVYLQSCSGGIFQGDDLRIRIAAGAGASAHVTSAASTVVHGMETAGARQVVELEAAAGALLEYLPDPLILFPRARLHNAVRLRLDPQATALLGDALLLHDPRSPLEGQRDAFELLESEIVVHDPAGRLLVRDRFRISGDDLARALPGVNGRYLAQASFFAFTAARPAAALVEALRTALAPIPEVYAAASALPNGAGAWVRVLAHDAIGVRAALHAAWAAARTALTGQAPAARRK